VSDFSMVIDTENCKRYVIVYFEPLPRQLPHFFSFLLKYFQPLLVNSFSPLSAEVREVLKRYEQGKECVRMNLNNQQDSA